MDPRPKLPLRARQALIGAVGLLGLLGLEWYLVFHVGFVERADRSIYYGFLGLSDRPHVTRIASFIAGLCDPIPYIFIAAVPVVIALLRRRALLALAIALILLCANETTELLKPLLAAPRPQDVPPWVVHPGSWPSGHATASMALALCLVVAVPRRWRPTVAAVGAAFAVAVSYSFLTLGWHDPSDALGGFLMASIWTLLGIAGLSVVEARRHPAAEPRPAPLAAITALTPSAAAASATVLLFALVFLVRPASALSYARLHVSFLAGAAGLAALGLSLAAGVLLTVRR